MKTTRGFVFGLSACAILAHGCGGSESSGGAGNKADVAPRGEDEMKKQMEILRAKGVLSRVPGVPHDAAAKKH